MNGDKMRVEVRLIDPESGVVVGQASTEIGLRTDLLTAMDAGPAQDWYATTCSAVGTAAYREAFPRSGREAPG